MNIYSYNDLVIAAARPSNENHTLKNSINCLGAAVPNIAGYSGIFDGSGYTIFNFATSSTLVGSLSGTIKRLGLWSNTTISMAGGGGGVLIHEMNGGMIQDCWTNVTVTSVDYGVAALFSYSSVNRGTVRNCYTIGDMTNNGVCAGIIQSANFPVNVYNCFSLGTYNTSYGAGICRSNEGNCNAVRCWYAYSQVFGPGTQDTNKSNYYSSSFGPYTGTYAWDAATWSWSGVWYARLKSDTIYISSPYQMINIGPSDNVVLLNDIDMSNWGNWIPIGSVSQPYTGNFNGNGMTIRGLSCTYGTTNSAVCPYAGLFGNFAGTVTNLNIVVRTLMENGAANVGAIVGQNSGGTISQCNVYHDTIGTGTIGGRSFGGICGKMLSGTIQNCSANLISTASTNITNCSMGGIVGEVTSGTITQCKSSSSISTPVLTNMSNQGGIVGLLTAGTVQYCVFTGYINYTSASVVNNNVGGIVGQCVTGTISNCYNKGNVFGYTSVGGILGLGTLATPAAITNCYSIGQVIAYNSGTGGITNANATCVYSYYSGQIIGLGTNILGGDMKRQLTYVGWDFAVIWKMTENVSYPSLRWETA